MYIKRRNRVSLDQAPILYLGIDQKGQVFHSSLLNTVSKLLGTDSQCVRSANSSTYKQALQHWLCLYWLANVLFPLCNTQCGANSVILIVWFCIHRIAQCSHDSTLRMGEQAYTLVILGFQRIGPLNIIILSYNLLGIKTCRAKKLAIISNVKCFFLRRG